VLLASKGLVSLPSYRSASCEIRRTYHDFDEAAVLRLDAKSQPDDSFATRIESVYPLLQLFLDRARVRLERRCGPLALIQDSFQERPSFPAEPACVGFARNPALIGYQNRTSLALLACHEAVPCRAQGFCPTVYGGAASSNASGLS